MAKELRFTPPPKLMGYLSVLVRDSILGSTENEVALTLLKFEVERRLLADYHAKIVPSGETKEN